MNFEELKLKYGRVYTIVVPLDEDDSTKIATIYLKKPDRAVRSLVSKMVSVDTGKAIEAALKALYIGGDDLKIVTENDDALFSCETPIVEIMSKQQAILKKN